MAFPTLALVAVAILVNASQVDTPALPGPGVDQPQAGSTSNEMTAAERELKLSRGTTAALDQGLYPIARAGADELIRTIEARAGPDSPELIAPLANRASACLELGDPEPADKDAQRALALLGDRGGASRVSVLLIAGRAALALSDSRRAQGMLEEALSIATHTKPRDKMAEARVYEQLLFLLTSRGESALTDGEIARGNRYVAALQTILTDIYEKDPGGLGMALPVVADWYLEIRNIDRARTVLSRSVTLLETAYGPGDPRLSLSLRSLASCSFREHLHGAEAMRLLARAATLPNDGSFAGAYEHAEALAMQADAHVTFGKPEEGIAYYSQAWETLARNEQIGAVGANSFFAQPVPLYLALTANLAPSHQDRTTLTLDMIVTATGLVEQPQVVGNGGGSAVIELQPAMRMSSTRWRYRPRVVDGTPVASTGHRAVWNFRGANWVPKNALGPNSKPGMALHPGALD